MKSILCSAALLGAAAAGMVHAAQAVIPDPGFLQNIGEYSSDVLFARGDLVLYRDRIQFAEALPIRLAGANPAVAVTGQSPISFPLNAYWGSDRSRWRENVPHFTGVRYTQIYPGIDLEWTTGTRRPVMRIVVAPGADPRQFIFRLPDGLAWTSYGAYVAVSSPFSYYTFAPPTTYQQSGDSRLALMSGYVQVDANSFRPDAPGADPALPLVFEMAVNDGISLYPSTFKVAADNGIVAAGSANSCCSNTRLSFLAKTAATGEPLFMEIVGVTPNWLATGRAGDTTLAGPLGNGLDGWVARFDSNGKLTAATNTGGAPIAFALDDTGAVYFSTATAVTKWIPGLSDFSFTAPVANVYSLSASGGGVAFAAQPDSDQYISPGAYRSQQPGLLYLYVGTLDRLTGRITMATYAPIYGVDPPSNPQSFVALAPDGSVWISSVFLLYQYGNAHTLVAVSTDGSRVFHSASYPDLPQVAFDAAGNVWVALMTSWPNLPTAPDAPRRAPCSYWSLYLEKLDPAGYFLDGTYLPTLGSIVTFDGPDRIFVQNNQDIVRVDTSRPSSPSIGCIVHFADRQSRTGLTPGGVYTLVGNGFGPPAEILINQTPVPIVTPGQGLTTFYVPKETALGAARVDVRVNGKVIACTDTLIGNYADFSLIAADYAGHGEAVAVNQDGTMNGPKNPARWGSVVAVFGAGPLPSPLTLSLGGVNNVYGSPRTAAIEYAGSPWLAGILQINFRLPANTLAAEFASGWILIHVGPGQLWNNPTRIWVAP
jgi:uncharacterized protein (TIGR03437 family)